MSIIGRIHNMIVAMPYGLEKMLSLMDIEESTDIKTACVPIGGRPKIIVNPEYVAKNCDTDQKLFMLIQHELHHLLLGHTRLFKRTTLQHNIAFDAIINSMLCRSQPEPEWTALFRDSYSVTRFPECLLRPPKGFPREPSFPTGMPENIQSILHTLYYSNEGTFFDVFDLLVKIVSVKIVAVSDAKAGLSGEASIDGEETGFVISTDSDILEDLLGTHDEDVRGLEQQDDPDLFDIVREIVGEWPQPPDPIKGRSLNDVLSTVSFEKRRISNGVVEQIAHAIIRSVQVQGIDNGGLLSFESVRVQQCMPSRDRRAFAMQQVGGLVPLYAADIPKVVFTHNEVAIYVDVSGSMSEYPKYLLTAVNAVHRKIKVRVFVFSTVVEEIEMVDFRQRNYRTTNGTDGNIVWKHIDENQFASAVLLTDGYLGRVAQTFTDMKTTSNIQVLLTPDGTAMDVENVSRHTETLKSL
jgi:hypothetical protein